MVRSSNARVLQQDSLSRVKVWTDIDSRRGHQLEVHRFLSKVSNTGRCDFRTLTLPRLADSGTLPLRMYLMGYSPSTSYLGNDSAAYPKLHNYGKYGRLNLRAAKLFADGGIIVLLPAAMSRPLLTVSR